MRMMINRKYDDCPACKQAMFIALEVEVPDEKIMVDADRLTATDAKIIGCVTNHDCRPKVKRDMDGVQIGGFRGMGYFDKINSMPSGGDGDGLGESQEKH